MANSLVGALFSESFTPAQLEQGKGFGLGDVYADSQGNRYVFVQFGVGGATPNFVVSIKADNSALMATNSVALRGERVGVYVGTAAAAATEYGWVQIYGAVNVQTDVATANVAMATTTTAGQIDDAVTTGTKNIHGLTLTSARTGSAGLAAAYLIDPHITSTN